MPDFLQFIERRRAHPLRRGIGRHQFRMGMLEFHQLAEQAVVGSVGDLWLGVYVVEAVMPTNLVPQKGQSSLDVGCGHRMR